MIKKIPLAARLGGSFLLKLPDNAPNKYWSVWVTVYSAVRTG
jgi:hypothetical protein